MKQKIVVSKMWHKPSITISAFLEELEITMDINDFLQSICHEIGNPTFILTNEKLKAKLIEAKEKVIKEMKKASVSI